jgi:hypothetical protein
MGLADHLLQQPSRWGLIGVEFIFFHHFFNEALQAELKEMRRQLYGCDSPPAPMNLEEADKLLGSLVLSVRETEAVGQVALEHFFPEAATLDEITRRALHRLVSSKIFGGVYGRTLMEVADLLREKGLMRGVPFVDLSPGVAILVAPMDDGEWPGEAATFWSIVRRLQGLERALPTYPLSLYLSVVCGTPPVPPNITANAEIDANTGQTGLCLRVYSAKTGDIGGFYSSVVEHFLPYAAVNDEPVVFEWRRGDLPYLELKIVPNGGTVPRPSRVRQAFKSSRIGKRFYDSKPRIKDYALEIEAWAKYALSRKCRMGNRDILKTWAEARDWPEEKIDEKIDAIYSPHTNSQEVVLSQQIRRISARIEEMRALISSPASLVTQA